MSRTVYIIGLLTAVVFTGNILADEAKPGEAYYGFLEEPTNSRALAMGSAATASLGSGGFAFYNPALSSVHKPSVTLEFGKLYEDLGRGYLEFNYTFPQWFLGLSFQSQSITFEYADERGVKSGSEGSEQGVMASLTAGFIKERFAAGLTVNGIHHRIANDYSNGVTASIGAIYHIIPGNLTGGIAIFNFYGRNTRLLDSTNHFHGDELPTTGRAGVSWTDTIKGKVPYTVSSDIAYSFNYEKLMVPVGVEAWVLPALALRIGKRINHPTDVMTMGIGLKLANLKYDVAFTPVRLVSDVEMKWAMDLTYELPSPKKRLRTAQSQLVDSVSHNDSNTTFRADDSANIKPESVVTPATAAMDTGNIDSISNEGSSDTVGGNQLQELLREDSTGTAEIDLEKTSEKEIPSDTAYTKSATAGTPANLGADDETSEVKIPEKNDGISKNEDTREFEPAGSDTVKTE